MLRWKECSLLNNTSYISFDVEVIDAKYYNNVYLDSVYLDVFTKPEDYLGPSPTNKAKLIWQQDSMEPPVKRVHQYIDVDLIKDNLMVLYAIATGEPSDDAPCGDKNKILVGVVYDKALLYQNSLKLLNNLKGCEPNKEFIDYILRVKAFELAIKTGDIKAAIYYWNTFFKKEIVYTKTNCGCNG